MNSSNHPSAYGYQPQGDPGHYYPPKPHVPEQTLKGGTMLAERKILNLELKENARGRFLRITENCGVHRNSIIIPATGLPDVLKMVAEMAEAAAALPQKAVPG